jgi:hypothetical protein
MRNALIVLALIAPLEAQAGTVVDVGAGLMGAAGGNFISKPSDVTLQTPAGTGETSLYPGFGGFTPGGGLMLDARVFGLVGLEVDVLYMSNAEPATSRSGRPASSSTSDRPPSTYPSCSRRPSRWASFGLTRCSARSWCSPTIPA